jgi:hypothetical protein
MTAWRKYKPRDDPQGDKAQAENDRMIRDLIAILPAKARERVRPDLLPQGEAELNERLAARKAVRKAYSQVQR